MAQRQKKLNSILPSLEWSPRPRSATCDCRPAANCARLAGVAQIIPPGVASHEDASAAGRAMAGQELALGLAVPTGKPQRENRPPPDRGRSRAEGRGLFAPPSSIRAAPGALFSGQGQRSPAQRRATQRRHARPGQGQPADGRPNQPRAVSRADKTDRQETRWGRNKCPETHLRGERSLR